MTALLTRATTPLDDRPSGTAPRLAAAVPWLLVAVGYGGALHLAGTPDRAIALYGVHLAVAVVLPGTLVHRAVRGSRGNLPEDLGYGAATGLLVLLAGWALCAATGLQPALRYWPLVVPVVFAAVPRLRRHWRTTDPRPLPLRWSWAVCGALLFVVVWAAGTWPSAPLPPATTAYYQDLLYHLALVQEMTRSMPFEVPQLAGDTLR